MRQIIADDMDETYDCAPVWFQNSEFVLLESNTCQSKVSVERDTNTKRKDFAEVSKNLTT